MHIPFQFTVLYSYGTLYYTAPIALSFYTLRHLTLTCASIHVLHRCSTYTFKAETTFRRIRALISVTLHGKMPVEGCCMIEHRIFTHNLSILWISWYRIRAGQLMIPASISDKGRECFSPHHSNRELSPCSPLWIRRWK